MIFSPDIYAPIFQRFSGKMVGYLRPSGNAGDHLIEAATFQLFDYFKVRYVIINGGPTLEFNFENLKGLSTVFIAGGGYLGKLYQLNWHMRKTLLNNFKGETIFLPQTITDAGDTHSYSEVWLREKTSFDSYAGNKFLGHDLAFAFNMAPYEALMPIYNTGFFLREDSEANKHDKRDWINFGDPAKLAKNYEHYIKLASHFKRIITDRLHFAIAGIKLKREVHLIANSYHKNKSIYEHSLKDNFPINFYGHLNEVIDLKID